MIIMLGLKLLENIGFNIIVKDSNYEYNGKVVPRVTHILSSMLHEDSLMIWSNNIGLYQRKKYKDTLEMSATIGTHTHNGIEAYIKDDIYSLDLSHLPPSSINSINNGIESFKYWYDNITKSHNVEVVGIEQPLSCEWFGGTYDFLVRIDGKLYLVDFKTSNHISCRYFYQLAAYKYMLSLQGITIDGCIILQVSKSNIGFNEYLLDLNNQKHKKFLDDCTECFFSLVYAYYNRLYTENEFKEYMSER